jgi:hypothetical protein
MTLNQRINALSALGVWLDQNDETLQSVILRSFHENAWFTPENTSKAIQSIVDSFLIKEKLTTWATGYPIPETSEPKTIGLVMAGNIPLVGFHDLIAVFITGHKSLIKLSDKDSLLLPCILNWLFDYYPETRKYFEITDRLKDFDAVIATGSNNSARYFETYFGKYPHIIRKNRNSVAILDGKESPDDLLKLGEDVFTYFGLGCRNVSKLYVPEGYDFTSMLEIWMAFENTGNHNKFKNNFEYNYALVLLNNQPHLSNGIILLTENQQLSSRIAGLHYEHYADPELITQQLLEKAAEIQCFVSNTPFPRIPVQPFGTTQSPGLSDYADGIDTVAFLLSIY